MDRPAVQRWVDGYVRAWRTLGTGGLGELFAPEMSYLPSVGSCDRGSGRAGPVLGDAAPRARPAVHVRKRIIAVDGDTAVVRVAVDYGSPAKSRWRDLWVLRFTADGHCAAFEEWPFAPGQPDGHER